MNRIDEQVNVERPCVYVCVRGGVVKYFMPKTRLYSSPKVLRPTIFNDDMQQGKTRADGWPAGGKGDLVGCTSKQFIQQMRAQTTMLTLKMSGAYICTLILTQHRKYIYACVLVCKCVPARQDMCECDPTGATLPAIIQAIQQYQEQQLQQQQQQPTSRQNQKSGKTRSEWQTALSRLYPNSRSGSRKRTIWWIVLRERTSTKTEHVMSMRVCTVTLVHLYENALH